MIGIKVIDPDGEEHSFVFDLQPDPLCYGCSLKEGDCGHCKWTCEIHEDQCDLESVFGMTVEECRRQAEANA